MEDRHREILRHLRVDIAKDLNVDKVAQYLFSKKILDSEDMEEIKAETTATQKAYFFLDLLPKKGPCAFAQFCKALNKYNCSWLTKRMQASLAGNGDKEVFDSKPRSIGLPKQAVNFVGRMPLCDEIKTLLTGNKRHQLVTLVSPPGFGKTEVAKAVGHMFVTDLKIDVLYFSLREKPNLTVVAKDILEAVSLPVGDEPVKQIIGYLTSLDRETVLILDNTEDLQAMDGPRFEDFLEYIGSHAHHVVTLSTSRERISKLNLFRSLTKHIPLMPLNDIHSAAFLRNLVNGISEQCVNLFVKDCGGIPLLLCIASAFLNRETVDALELHRKLQNCPHGFFGVSDRDPLITEKLHCPLKVFFSQLPSDLRNVLESLAAFPTSFVDNEALILFPGKDLLDIQLLLGELVLYSLLQKDDNSNIYSMHPLVQSFCKLHRNEPKSSFKTAIRLFSQHYLILLRQLSKDFVGTDCKTVITRYSENKTNICHALLASTDDIMLQYFGLGISTEAVNFFAKVLSMDEFMHLYSQFREVANALSDKTCYSECLVSIGFRQLCYDGFPCTTQAKNILHEAFELHEKLGISDTEVYGHCLSKLGLCHVASGDVKRGFSLIAQAIAVRKKRVRTGNEESGKNERMLLAGGFCDLGMALFSLGQYRAAVNVWINMSLVRYLELLGNHPFTASLLGHIGNAYQKLGNCQRAVVFKKKCLAMRRVLLGEEHPDTARAYYGLGCALGAQGNDLDALEMLKQALKIQLCVHASKHDIERSKQEVNRICGRTGLEPLSTILSSIHL